MSTWISTYFDPAAAAAKKEKLAAAKKAAHDKAVLELRAKMEAPEGKEAAEILFKTRDVPTEETVTSDAYLRRWLVARDWDVEVTYKLLTDHASWRQHNVPKGFMPEEEVKVPLADDKTFMQGVDHEGRALVIVRVRNHICRKDLRDMRKFSIYIMDNMVELCDKQKNPGARLVSMFDMTDCSMANMDVACMRMILTMLGQHYVERLSAMYFYNPPLVFWGLWNSMKGLLPEVTRNKIKVIDPSDLRELRELVPDHVLPKEYGGQADLLPIDQAVRRFKLYPYLDGERDCTQVEAGSAVDATITGLEGEVEQLKVQQSPATVAVQQVAAS